MYVEYVLNVLIGATLHKTCILRIKYVVFKLGISKLCERNQVSQFAKLNLREDSEYVCCVLQGS